MLQLKTFLFVPVRSINVRIIYIYITLHSAAGWLVFRTMTQPTNTLIQELFNDHLASLSGSVDSL